MDNGKKYAGKNEEASHSATSVVDGLPQVTNTELLSSFVKYVWHHPP